MSTNSPEMTDVEFTVMEELYFMTNFDSILSQTSLSEDELLQTLQTLQEKGWLKCAALHDGQEVEERISDWGLVRQYNLMATKAGLLAHNGY